MTPTRQTLNSYVGDMRQLAGIELVHAVEGPERGVRKAFVKSGSGLEFVVHLDRGFDIGEVRLAGHNLTWRSPVGAVHPHAHQEADGWLRRFPGGLLTTCGLENVGPAERAGPFHGSYSSTSATLTTQRSFWQSERYVSELVGEVRDYKLFGTNLQLVRRITTANDRHAVQLCDTVENQSFETQPLTLLYHCNFGYPLLAEGTTISFAGTATPRDSAARSELEQVYAVNGPRKGYHEKVYDCNLETDAQGYSTVALRNDALALGVTLRFLKTALPHFTLWKQLGEGAYVVGLEPGTCGVLGFEQERKLGHVVTLEPGERYETSLEFTFERGNL